MRPITGEEFEKIEFFLIDKVTNRALKLTKLGGQKGRIKWKNKHLLNFAETSELYSKPEKIQTQLTEYTCHICRVGETLFRDRLIWGVSWLEIAANIILI